MRRAMLLVFLISACGGDDAPPGDDWEARCAQADAELGVARPEGWTARTHCKYAPDDVAAVLPTDRVAILAIVMTATEYAAMQADLEALAGEGGGGGDPDWVAPCVGLARDAACVIDLGGGDEPGTCIPFDARNLGCFPDGWRAPLPWRMACEGLQEGDACTTATHDSTCAFDGIDVVCAPASGPGPGVDDPCAGQIDGAACTQGGAAGVCLRTTGPRICQVDTFDPGDVSDVPVEAAAPFWPRDPLYFHAALTLDGTRFTSVGIRYKGNNGLASSQGEKKPLRLKLDKWELDDVAITDQRMFGFQDLSLSPNQTDDSGLHQVLAAEVFRAHGVPAPQAGFVEVTLDTGAGPRVLGLYAITEVPDRPLLDRAFGSAAGNLYKPDGRGAHLVSFLEPSFHKQNNDAVGFEDVQAFVAALHASRADRAAWRAGLTARFDMLGFADAYAVNQAIGNWDTYGGLAHNFFLYGDPATAQLAFIPWDFDLAFDSSGPSDLSLRSFDGRWPLLQAIARDVEYATRYQATLAAVATAQLDSGALGARVDVLAALVRPAITREDAVGSGALERFDAGVAALHSHLDAQRADIAAYLGGQAKPRRDDGLALHQRWRQVVRGVATGSGGSEPIVLP